MIGFRRLLVLLTLVVAGAATAAPAHARVAYGITPANSLLTFNTNTPNTIAATTAITGLQPGETVLGIDVQPTTGQMYALGSTSRLYTLNTQSGVATQVGFGPFSPALSGTNFGFDFNPVNGRIRVVSDTDQNLELIPTNGQAISHGNIDPTVGPSGAAYSNNFAGATTTTLFDIAQPGDLFSQLLSPDDGGVTAIGAGLGVTTGAQIGFDIGPDNAAFATLTSAGDSSLYTVNTASGVATLVGGIGTGSETLDGLALARPLETTPLSVAFSQEAVGGTTAATPVTVTNTSDSAIAVAPTITGANANQFTITSNTCGTSIASGAGCTIGVAFKPTQPGSDSATLDLGGAGQGNDATIPLSGTGVGASIALSHSALAFGTQAVRSPSAPQTVTVTNTGNSPLTVSSVSLGGDVRDFAVHSQTCTHAAIAPGGTCQVSMVFDPISQGAKSAHLHLVDNARNGSGQVSLTGTGAVAHMSLSATTLTFPSVLTGATGAAQNLTVRNTGQAPLVVSSLSFSGSGARSFAVSGQTCTGASVAPGATCTVSLRFAPLATGAQSAVLHVPTNAVGAHSTVTLAGTGLARGARASFGRKRRSFGTRRLRRNSKVQRITVKSTGTAALDIRRVRITGRARKQFRIRSQNCTAGTFPRGQRCAIRVRFRPTSPGRKRATLRITDNAPGSGRITLTGRGRR